MKDDNMVIGIVGGMGSFATVDFFRRLVEAFPAEKEWERPRILIDNNCTMPSRVRAILYNEKKEELIEALSKSVHNLILSGANRIILACNTSHVFLDDIIDNVPESKDCFINIVDECGIALKEKEDVLLIASEGTIETGIYSTYFKKYDINVISPDKEQFCLLREFIESVKQNDINNVVMNQFEDFIEKCDSQDIILGCTELPILFDKCIQNGYKSSKNIIDPLQCVIEVLKTERRLEV